MRATITNGRDSQMPAHAMTLGDSKVRLLAAYVLSIASDEEHEHDEHDDDLAAASGRSPGSAPHVGTH